MNEEEALVILKTLLKQECLTDIQELVFRQVWSGQTYLEIAQSSGYDANYVKNVGSKLWKLLSNALSEEVTKSNLRSVLRRRYIGSWLRETPNFVSAKETTANIHCDWGEAVDVTAFYGRTEELNTLKQWIVGDRCRLVALLGMGGIGKTALSVKLAEQIQDEFEYLIWRSLHNAPPLQEILVNLIQFLSNQQVTEATLPKDLDSRISRLIEYLRSSRCLLVLDNAETILRDGDRAGYYREGYSGYGELFKRVGEARHTSCLVLTSREKPKEFVLLEGETLPVRSLQLTGLKAAEGREVFRVKGSFTGSESECNILIEHYAGNPLAKMVAAGIQELLDSNISEFLRFLEQGTLVFDDIYDLL